MHTHVTMHVYTLDMTYIIMISDFELAENAVLFLILISFDFFFLYYLFIYLLTGQRAQRWALWE